VDKRLIVVFTFLFGMTQISAQEIKPKGYFLRDSIKIGEEIGYALSVKYPKEYQIIYPDSTFDYGSFEFYSKTFFDTKVDNTYALDSVVYNVSTFEIDPILGLQLPIYILNGPDSIEIFSNSDSVILVQYITQVPDSLQLVKNVDYHPVTYDLNYPYLLISAGILIVLIIAALLLFGGKIRTKIKRYRLRKDFEKFSLNLEKGINNIRQNPADKSLIEEVLVVWKKYMEGLENKPFTKYTSKEISRVGYGEKLDIVLKSIDRAIYSNIDIEEIHKNFERLEDFTTDIYLGKIKALKNG